MMRNGEITRHLEEDIRIFFRRVAMQHGDFTALRDERRAGAPFELRVLEREGQRRIRCWRFGQEGEAFEAGGIAPRTALYQGYEAAGGAKIDPAAVAYWEILAAARWAAIALLQGDRYFKDGETSIELALTGAMVPEMEFDGLEGIAALAGVSAQPAPQKGKR